MKDNLKKYIQQHRDDFDDTVVPPRLFQGILKEMDNRKSERMRLGLRSFLAVAASLLVLFFLSVQFLFRNPGNHDSKSFMPSEELHLPLLPQVMQETELPGNITVPLTTNRVKVQRRSKGELQQKILTALRDENSVAGRIEAILTINDLKTPDSTLIAALCNSFENDESSNVRLSALNVLMKFSDGDSIVRRHLLNALVTQQDPMIQMELVRVMKNNTDPETTQRLIKIADDPFTITPVKEQIYYALLERQ